jgi:pre-mRNA-splicing factor CWC22
LGGQIGGKNAAVVPPRREGHEKEHKRQRDEESVREKEQRKERRTSPQDAPRFPRFRTTIALKTQLLGRKNTFLFSFYFWETSSSAEGKELDIAPPLSLSTLLSSFLLLSRPPFPPPFSPKREKLDKGENMYVPPHKRRQAEEAAAGGADDTPDAGRDEAQQRHSWEALRRSIQGTVNRVAGANLGSAIPELLTDNLVRGRGLFVQAVMRAQAMAHAAEGPEKNPLRRKKPESRNSYDGANRTGGGSGRGLGFKNRRSEQQSAAESEPEKASLTAVLAALVAVVNTKLPEIGHLLLRRLTLAFQRSVAGAGGGARNKAVLNATLAFIAELLNQGVAGAVLALQICAFLLEKPTDDSVAALCDFVALCGPTLQSFSPEGFEGVFERLRAVLQETRSGVSARTRFAIEDLFALRKRRFDDRPAVLPILDLCPEDEQIPHDDIGLEHAAGGSSQNSDAGLPTGPETELNVFAFDPQFEENEDTWDDMRREILGDDVVDDILDAREQAVDAANSSGAGDVYHSGSENDDVSFPDGGEPEVEDGAITNLTKQAQLQKVIDDTGTDLVNLRRTIYLTVMSSMDFQECAHKILKQGVPEGLEVEVCNMVIECCSQEKTYGKFFGLLAQRLCMVQRVYAEGFETMFYEKYITVHRLETNKIRNIARLFAHLLANDAVRWDLWEYVRLNEEETTSSSRIFLKYLLQELAEHLGTKNLSARLMDPSIAEHTAGLFPASDVVSTRNTRFAINFFVAIGMPQLAEPLRTFLQHVSELEQEAAVEAAARAQLEIEEKAARRGSGSGSYSGSGSGSGSGESSSGSDSGSDSSEFSDSSSGSWTSTSGSESSSSSSPSPPSPPSRSRSRSRSPRSPKKKKKSRSPPPPRPPPRKEEKERERSTEPVSRRSPSRRSADRRRGGEEVRGDRDRGRPIGDRGRERSDALRFGNKFRLSGDSDSSDRRSHHRSARSSSSSSSSGNWRRSSRSSRSSRSHSHSISRSRSRSPRKHTRRSRSKSRSRSRSASPHPPRKTSSGAAAPSPNDRIERLRAQLLKDRR